MNRPNASGSMSACMNLPAAFRLHNSAATSVAQIMKIGAVNVTLGDMSTTKGWPHLLAGAGGHCSQGQTGGTLGTTALLVNNTNPVAAVPTNTTAALGVGLGGLFHETDTLAVATDGIISSFQVPLGTAAIPGKSLYITRINLDSTVLTACTGGPYSAIWYLAYGHTAVSLLTAEAATTKAPRRVPLGVQVVAVNQAVNTMLGRIDLALDVPIVVQPGEFLQLVKRKTGTTNSAGAIMHVVGIGGYWE